MKPLEMIKKSAIQNVDAYGPGAGKWCFICYQHIAGPLSLVSANMKIFRHHSAADVHSIHATSFHHRYLPGYVSWF